MPYLSHLTLSQIPWLRLTVAWLGCQEHPYLEASGDRASFPKAGIGVAMAMLGERTRRDIASLNATAKATLTELFWSPAGETLDHPDRRRLRQFTKTVAPLAQATGRVLDETAADGNLKRNVLAGGRERPLLVHPAAMLPLRNATVVELIKR